MTSHKKIQKTCRVGDIELERVERFGRLEFPQLVRGVSDGPQDNAYSGGGTSSIQIDGKAGIRINDPI